MNKFKPINRDTPYLLPPSLQDWLPQDHMARFVVDIVDREELARREQRLQAIEAAKAKMKREPRSALNKNRRITNRS